MIQFMMNLGVFSFALNWTFQPVSIPSVHSIITVELFDVDFFGRLHASASVLSEFPESLYLSQSNMGL